MSINALEWLNRNCLRSFPLAEDGYHRSINTQWDLPNELIADSFLVIPSGRVVLGSVTVTERIISVTLARPDGTTLAIAMAVLGRDSSFSRVAVQAMVPGVSGFLSFGSIMEPEAFASLPQGSHLFRDAYLENRTVINSGDFPLTSISGLGYGDPMTGVMELRTAGDMLVGVSVGEDEGDPLYMMTLSLIKPENYLSPCEEKPTPCACLKTPIRFLNSVPPDDEGNITIEVVDDKGNVIPMGVHGLAFSILTTGDLLCTKPAMPDAIGRLPVNYDLDKDPITAY